MKNLELCMNNLDKTTENFLNGTMDSQDEKIVTLLKSVIVIEKNSITSERLYNQLKENYFDSDEQTIEFVNKLYKFDYETICELINMFIDELNSENLTKEEIDFKAHEIIPILDNINPGLVKLLNENI